MKLPEMMNVLDKALDVKAKDIRQEPPIPVERVIAEKQSVEKSDKIAAAPGSSVPDIKETGTIKALIENVNVQSQISDVVKLEESVATLKSEEKIKMIEEKERSADLQKNNDNLINLDAIKKEESELAADGDVANARVAERHEQLRKTLEKHKLEQRQMMQEQKEILKDIKEQKQEFEREKQRMAKDEILKKNEKAQINNMKEDTLPEDSLRESGKRDAETNQVNIDNNKHIKETLHDEEWNVAGKVKSNEELRIPDETNDVNVAPENKPENEKKLESLREISQNLIPEEVQKSPVGDTVDKFQIVDKERIDLEAPERSLIRNDETKIGKIEFNDSVSMKGPVLNILSKGALQKSIVEEGLLAKEIDNHQVKEEKREILANEVINASDKLQSNHNDSRFSMPIALKMSNQSRSYIAAVAPSPNKSEPQVQAIHRDILENYEREKRDIGAETNASDVRITDDRLTEISEPLLKIDEDRETCSKLRASSGRPEAEKESKKGGVTIKSSTTEEVPLIKTNVYLSEQGVTNMIPIDLRVALNAEHMSMKQRDLKALNSKDNTEI